MRERHPTAEGGGHSGHREPHRPQQRHQEVTRWASLTPPGTGQHLDGVKGLSTRERQWDSPSQVGTPLLTLCPGRATPPPSDHPGQACVSSSDSSSGPLRRVPRSPGWGLRPARLPRTNLPPTPLRPALSPTRPPAQVANLGQAIHLQLCSVRIPQAKEDALQAITLLARNHTPELVAAFLDFSVTLDRCPAPLPSRPPAPPSGLPR